LISDQEEKSNMANKVRIAIIGAGAVSDYHHVPGIRIDPRAELVAACDPNEELLAQRLRQWGPIRTTTSFEQIAGDPDIDAVIIATPNDTHRPIALACLAAGKHVMCEKPLGVNFDEARQMYLAARENNLRHMTAFTYRFAPSMRYLKHLIDSGALGTPRHFRSQRFLDLPETSWGWRQSKKRAGAGDLFDMTIHRIDFAQDLLGPIESVCGAVAQFVPRDRTADGKSCAPSEVDDWSALIGRFQSGAVGVWEGSTLMKGHYNDGFGFEWAEVNGSEASAVYRLTEPNTILLGRHNESLQPVPVPAEFLVAKGSPRKPNEGIPSTVFRYDLVWEFVSAIVEGRDAVPGFDAGASAQLVADSVLQSFEKRAWLSIESELA
jgi:predicted dehydrogenase